MRQLAAFIVLSVLAACAPRASAPGLDLRVHALTLDGVTDVVWDLTVRNEAGDVVWSTQLDSATYGDGKGSLAYVGPCDATDVDGDGAAVNTVELDLVDVVGPPAGTWVDPTAAGPLVRTAACIANTDTLVTFDVVILRAAGAGFVDIAVSFEDLFCSAKLDCVAGDAGGLLSDPGTGAPLPTAVLALACTAGPDADTRLYLDDLAITCASGESYTIDPSVLGTGQGAPPLSPSSLVTQTSGADGLASWAVLVGLDPAQLANPNTHLGCVLTTAGTASDGPLTGNATPADSTYPVITWDVPLTDASGALTCSEHALLGGNGVGVSYTDGDPVDFAHEAGTTSAPPPPPPPPPPPSNAVKRIFSAPTRTGALNGIAAADSFCQSVATSAGLPGTYRAWLCTDNPAQSVAARFTPSSGDYVRPDGVVVANGWADLTDGTLDAPIRVDALGNVAAPTTFWSSCRPNGQPSPNLTSAGSIDCDGWTTTGTVFGDQEGYVGSLTATNLTWSQVASPGRDCGQQHRLVCVQQ